MREKFFFQFAEVRMNAAVEPHKAAEAIATAQLKDAEDLAEAAAWILSDATTAELADLERSLGDAITPEEQRAAIASYVALRMKK